MAMILAFQIRKDKAALSHRQKREKAQVIIFPGVRYERLPDPTFAGGKLTKKTRKTA